MAKKRRLMNQMNVVPYIDVMLVLLVIFMVTAPMIQTGTVDLPSVDKAPAPKADAMIVVVSEGGKLALKRNAGAHEESLSDKNLVSEVQAAIHKNPEQPFVVAAHKKVDYEKVISTLNVLKRAGVTKVGLQTQVGAYDK